VHGFIQWFRAATAVCTQFAEKFLGVFSAVMLSVRGHRGFEAQIFGLGLVASGLGLGLM